MTTAPSSASSAVASPAFAMQVQDALVREIRKRVTHGCRQSALGDALGATLMDLVPDAAIVLGRLHQASNE